MAYIAKPQRGSLATGAGGYAAGSYETFASSANLAQFASPQFALLSSTTQARYAGHSNARSHAKRAPVLRHPTHQRQRLPPGVEQQPF